MVGIQVFKLESENGHNDTKPIQNGFTDDKALLCGPALQRGNLCCRRVKFRETLVTELGRIVMLRTDAVFNQLTENRV